MRQPGSPHSRSRRRQAGSRQVAPERPDRLNRARATRPRVASLSAATLKSSSECSASQGARVLSLLVISGSIVWGAATVSRLTRRLWPVRCGISRLMRAELICGGAALLLLAAAGPTRPVMEAVTCCLCAAITCGLLAAGTAAWRRYRNGMPVVRLRRSRISDSHVYVWVEVICGVAAALAPPLVVASAGSALAGAIGAVSGAGAAGLVAGIRQSVRLRQHNRAASRASLRATP